MIRPTFNSPRTPVQSVKEVMSESKESYSIRIAKLENKYETLQSTVDNRFDQLYGLMLEIRDSKSPPESKKKVRQSSRYYSSDDDSNDWNYQSQLEARADIKGIRNEEIEDVTHVGEDNLYDSDADDEDQDMNYSYRYVRRRYTHNSSPPLRSRHAVATPVASPTSRRAPDTFGSTPTVTRRDPVLQRLASASSPPASNSAGHLLHQTIITTAPPYSFKLTTLKISKILEMKQYVYDYRMQYRMKINILLLLHEDIKNQLRNEHAHDMSRPEFDRLPQDVVWKMIKASSLPKNVDEWVRKLKEAVSFPEMPTYSPTIANFFKFYQSCLTFNRSFLDVYNILKEAEECIPPLWSPLKIPGAKGADATLVQLYLDYFPYETGYALFKLLIGKQRPRTIVAFTDMFTSQLRNENEKCEELKQLGTVLHDWKHKLLAERADAAPSLFSIQEWPPPTKSCFHVMSTGNYCPYGSKCNRSHKPADLERARAYWINTLSKVQYSDNTLITSAKTSSAAHHTAKANNQRSTSYTRGPGAHDESSSATDDDSDDDYDPKGGTH